MLTGLVKKVLGDDNTRRLKKLEPLVAAIGDWEPKIRPLTDEELAAKTIEFKKRLQKGETLEDILPEAFAVVREVARRTLGERHYDVQLMSGLIMHQGNITEMKTGEGKTLAATLPAYLNALTGEGVHIVTVNDYLARRDAVLMGQIYYFLGLSVGVINGNASSFLYDETQVAKDEERDEQGQWQIFYEYLKPVGRQEAYRADIVYGTNNEFGFDYLRDNTVQQAEQLVQRADDLGHQHFAIIDEVDSILIDESRTPLIISAPVEDADEFYRQFARIVKDFEEGRDYEIDRKLKTATLTDEGMSRAETALGVSNIYTEKGIKYVHHLETATRAKALFTKDKEYVIRDGEVVIVDEFTGRLQPGRRWSEGLHQAIEAKEGVPIKKESRTFATVTLQNYFRLYRKLAGMTGTAMTSQEEFNKVYDLEVVAVPTNKPSQRNDLPDQIFQTEAGKFKAVVKKIKELNQKGQPVLVGTVSIEKNEFLSLKLTQAGVPHKLLNAKNHEEEGKVIAGAGSKGSVVIATNMAGRGVDIKLGGPQATKEEADEIIALGGLFVLGTERHEARRIDNQLRGRSGRQGDPGETQFYVSLEDHLMRAFASERIKSMMGRFGLPEDEPIQNKMVSRAIESAQEKIEGMNFDTRKHLLEYDDLVNHQRITMYGRRRNILLGDEDTVWRFTDKAMEILNLTAEEKSQWRNQMDKLIETGGREVVTAGLRRLILQIMDMLWMDHLEAIDYTKSSVRLRAYGQRDPLVEFKREGLRLFKEMEQSMFDQVIKMAPRLSLQKPPPVETIKISNQSQTKVGRNDPCPCGAINPETGKVYKWKKCGMINAPHHQV
ncbi:MAG: preprotein translocase subunit SecA [Patescibacteria group bacterium]